MRKTLEALSEAVFPSNIYCACCGRIIDGTRPYALCDSCMKKMHWNNGRTCEKCGKALPETYRGGLMLQLHEEQPQIFAKDTAASHTDCTSGR